MIDSLDVTIATGDRVIINAWGDVRQCDVYAKGTVTGFARTRVRVAWDTEPNGPIGNVPPSVLGVLRRDGKPGFQGNATR